MESTTKLLNPTMFPEALAGAGFKLIFSLEYNFDVHINGFGRNKTIAEKYPNTIFVVFNNNPNVNEDGTVEHKNVISVPFGVGINRGTAFLQSLFYFVIKLKKHKYLLKPWNMIVLTG